MGTFFLAPKSAQALEIHVSYSYPVVGDWAPPPDDLVEGSILATFNGDEPFSPLSDEGLLEPVTPQTWTHRFTWDWTDPITVSFVGQGGDTVTVTAAPEPVTPFGSIEHQLLTFQISTAPENLWDPAIGIYVYGDNGNFLRRGGEWERSADLRILDPGTGADFTEPVGLRISGGWSRRFDQKSFRFYFDDYGSEDELVYDFFDGAPTNFQRLILRTHRFPFNCYNSDLLEGLWLDRGHLGSRIASAVGYLNHEYWGVYSLRERLDDEFLEETHGIESGTYTFIKDGVVERGDPDDWANLIASFSQEQSFASHAWFAEMSARIDLPTYVDWLILNIFSATADNGFDGNLAQLKQGDGPWEFIIWDEDDTFVAENLEDDYFQFFTAADQADFEAHWPTRFNYNTWTPSLQAWCTMFRGFMGNSEFKAFFFQRLDGWLNNEFSDEDLASKISAMVAEQGGEMGRHAERWNWDSPAEYTEHAQFLMGWSSERRVVVADQAADFREDFRQPVELVAFEAQAHGDTVHFNWQTLGERGNQGFAIMREGPGGGGPVYLDSYLGNPDLAGGGDTDEVRLYQAIDPAPVDGGMNRYFLLWFDEESVGHALPWVNEIWIANWQGLVFNEIMADNDTTLADGAGEYDDWLEIYNGSGITVSLDSLFVTDDPTQPMKHRLTGDFLLEPGEHQLLWADGNPAQGDDHLGFKLSSEGEGLYLFAPDGQTLISATEFALQVQDVAWARFSDGDETWSYSSDPTPGAANGSPRPEFLLKLNEMLGSGWNSIPDEFGEYDPWIEIFNPLPVPIPLEMLELRMTGFRWESWQFEEQIAPPGHQVLWLDGQPDQGPFHCPFLLEDGDGLLELSYTRTSEGVDTLSWQDMSPMGSVARIPDGKGPWLEGIQPTPGQANPLPEAETPLCINEFMALNGSTLADETGAFEDWVEIFNPGTESVSMLGMYLTDDPALPTRWAFPDTTIDAGGYLLVWCDYDTLDGPMHATFKLSANGESLALYFGPEDGLMMVDETSFGVQSLDVSLGRLPDGSENWDFLAEASPGYSNSPLSFSPPLPHTVTGLESNFPNPFNPSTTIVFTLARGGAVDLAVHDVRGRLVATLVQENLKAGRHQVVWDGMNLHGSPAASGVYLLRLKTEDLKASRRMLLLK